MGTIRCSAGYTAVRCKCYRAENSSVPWNVAVQACRIDGGYLAMPKNINEWRDIVNLLEPTTMSTYLKNLVFL